IASATPACPAGGVGGFSAFVGAQGTFVNTVVDLDAVVNAIGGGTSGAQGKTVYIAFVAETDCNAAGGTGWFIDDVAVTANSPAACGSVASPVQFLTARSTD